MSDSESDLLPNNMLTFQNHGTTVCAKGPNINSTSISNFSFRNNVMTSTMNMPGWNLDRPRYAESVYDQRSASYRREREVSPMSFHSASGMQTRNFHHSYYPGGMSSSRSVYNGRSGSPMSVRTIDSNTSMSARDIAFAFKNGHFNKSELEIIKGAFYKLLKGRARRRQEKKRNLRTFMKGYRRKSGGDSGDQASDSSISSDDCRSTRSSRSAFYKENMSSSRSTRKDLADLRRTMKESNMLRDCTDNFRQNTFKNMFSLGPQSLNNREKSQNQQNTMVASQKDRFKNGFLLPSQRFNQSVASMSISEKPERMLKASENKLPSNLNQKDRPVRNSLSGSEQEEIFGEVTVMEKTSDNRSGKRNLDDAKPVSEKKRIKPSSPERSKQKAPNLKITAKQNSKDFVFAKPTLPVKRPAVVKQPIKLPKPSQTKEKPVSNLPMNRILHSPEASTNLTNDEAEQPAEKVLASSQKLVVKLVKMTNQPSDIIPNPTVTTVAQETELEKCSNGKELCTNVESQQTSDLSMRPSFIKRKLFSQKVDVTEKNSSTDNVQIDSPQTNIYSKIQKEKNKARKLVASQSCLNRDVADDSNLLDLIHKIVPRDRMNVTSAINRSEIQSNKSKPANDITSVVPVCNDDYMSDTYTDEEIFGADGNEKEKEKRQSHQKIEVAPQDIEKEVHEKVDNKKVTTAGNQKKHNEVEKIQQVVPINQPLSPPRIENNGMKMCIIKCVRSFWDTDVESDFEITPLKNSALKVNGPVINTNPKVTSSNKNNNIKHIEPVANTTQITSTKAKLNKTSSNEKDAVKKMNHIKQNITLKESQKTNQCKPTTKAVNNNTDTKKNTLLSGKENESVKKPSTKKTKESEAAKISQKAKTSTLNNMTIKPKLPNSSVLKTHNNTIRIRTQRKPKINKCCGELDKSEQSTDDSLCRTLRSRKVDLSTSMKSEDSSICKKTTVKTKSNAVKQKKKVCNNNNIKEKSIPSDISFTLTSETPPSSKQGAKMKKSISYFNNTQRVTRRNDTSFTYTPENVNTTMCTRNSLKNNREIKSLLSSSSLFYRSDRNRHSKKIK